MFFGNDRNEDMRGEAPVALRDLCYYFDSVECDRLDQGALGRKTAQVLTLRQKLLSLPEQEFDAAIKTLEKLVESRSAASLVGKAAAPSRSEAFELFERTAENQKRTAPAERVSRV